MKYSRLFPKTTKQAPADEQSANAVLLERAGFIKKHMAGVYNYLPLGLKTLEKIKQVIREEMNNIGGQELLMTGLQPKELWEKTGRWELLGKDVMYQFKDQSDKEMGLAMTHEEVITDLVAKYINSYKELPFYGYQIQTKFRNELRARFGLIRGRELIMKDMYSFSLDQEEHQQFYDQVIKAYLKAFEKVDLKVKVVEASGGVFTKEYSHEFQVLVDSGEDEVIYCESCDFAQNREVTDLKAGDKCPRCGGDIKVSNGIEVGNIFHLGTKYTDALDVKVLDEKGQIKKVIMGCYGWGVSRAMGTIVEVSHDEKGIVWPENVAPFQVHLIGLDLEDNEVKEKVESTYKVLESHGIEVLYDDREGVRAGEKFADADLIGIPTRVVVSKKTEDKLEVKKRNSSETNFLSLQELVNEVKHQVGG